MCVCFRYIFKEIYSMIYFSTSFLLEILICHYWTFYMANYYYACVGLCISMTDIITFSDCWCVLSFITRHSKMHTQHEILQYYDRHITHVNIIKKKTKFTKKKFTNKRWRKASNIISPIFTNRNYNNSRPRSNRQTVQSW